MASSKQVRVSDSSNTKSNETLEKKYSKDLSNLEPKVVKFGVHLEQEDKDNRDDDRYMRKLRQKERARREKRSNKVGSGRSCSTMYHRFRILFLGPLLIRHRSKSIIFVELFVPPIICFIIFCAFTAGISWKQALRMKSKSDSEPNIVFPETDMKEATKYFRDEYVDSSGRLLLFFSPANNFTEAIIAFTIQHLKLEGQNRIDMTGQKATGLVGVKSSKELLQRVLEHRSERVMHKSPLSVEFLYEIDQNAALPYHLTYTIGTLSPAISITDEIFPFLSPPSSKDFVTPYILHGFVGLQHAIDKAFIRVVMEHMKVKHEVSDDLNILFKLNRKEKRWVPKKSLSDLPTLFLQMFYYPNFFNPNLRQLIIFIVTCTLVGSYLFLSYFIVRQIAQENLSGIKDLLRMHGLPIIVNWGFLFFHAVIFRGITALLVTFTLRAHYPHGTLISHTNYSYVLLIVWLHMITLTFFNYFIAVVTCSAFMSGFYAYFIGLISYAIPMTFDRIGFESYVANFVLALFFPNWCFANAMSHLIDSECDGKRITFQNMFASDHSDKLLSFGYSLIILLVTSVMYFILSIYLDLTSQIKLYPPTYKWYQFWMKSKQKFLSRKNHKQYLRDVAEGKHLDFPKPKIYETPEGKDKACYVKIRHLSKRYGNYHVALDDISLDIQHEEITVVLGHAGSGKSTLISILAGMVVPTQGYATINDFNVTFSSQKARYYSGLCTKKLIYFNLLTAEQHLRLCYTLRGHTVSYCKSHSEALLKRLRLWEVRYYYPDRMTSDEVKRLGIAMALADSPEVLLLDEPTTDMETSARREIWDIIKDLRKHHTIILTTNYMDEAEYLADKVVVLSHGKLICYGSIEYLRKQYDIGFFLHVVPAGTEKPKIDDYQHLIKSIFNEEGIPKPSPLTEENNLVIQMPPYVTYKSLAGFFKFLEEARKTLNYESYFMQRILFYDILIKIFQSPVRKGGFPDEMVRRDSIDDPEIFLENMKSDMPRLPLEVYTTDTKSHIRSLSHKRLTYIFTKSDVPFLDYVIPFLIIFATVWEAKMFLTPIKTNPLLNMTITDYPNAEIYYRLGAENPNSNFSAYIRTVLGSYGKEILKRDRMLITLENEVNEDRSYRKYGEAMESHIVAFEFRHSFENRLSYDLMGYFSSGALHSASLAVNIMSNMILRSLTKPGDPTYSINVVNDPLPLQEDYDLNRECGSLCFVFAFVISFALGFLAAALVTFPLKEKETGLKHLQLMSGVNALAYWLADCVYDVFLMMICTAIIVIMFCFGVQGAFLYFQSLATLALLLGIFLCWSSIFFAYFFSTLIPLWMNGFHCMFLVHVLTGIIAALFLNMIVEEPGSIVIISRCFFHLFPAYSVTIGLVRWFKIFAARNYCYNLPYRVQEMCRKPEEEEYLHYTGHQLSQKDLYKFIVEHDPGLGRCCEKMCSDTDDCYPMSSSTSNLDTNLLLMILLLLFQGFFYCLLCYAAETNCLSALSQKINKRFREYQEKKHPSYFMHLSQRSEEVQKEKELVDHLMQQDQFPREVALLAHRVSKSQGTYMGVNDFNFAFKKGECVAILGGGASGKTLVCQIIAGEIVPTDGMCYVDFGCTFKSNRNNYLRKIEYCPKKDAIFENFTGKQMLDFIGELKGIPARKLSNEIRLWLNVFELSAAAKARCKLYSRGMLRRLSIAMAMLGSPDIVVLDEPTVDVDPESRRIVWGVIRSYVSSGRTVIFTSYSLQECEYLASRIVVMAEGQVQSLGTAKELAEKFSKGCTILFRLRHDVLTPVDMIAATMAHVQQFKQAMLEKFRHTELIDEQDNLLLYFVRNMNVSWSKLLAMVEDIVKQFDLIIERFDVNEATVEDIYILLTNKFRLMDQPRIGDPYRLLKRSMKKDKKIKPFKKMDIVE